MIKKRNVRGLTRIFFICLLLIAHCSLLTAQDFGFGFDESESDSSALSINISGEAIIEFPFYFKDYKFEAKEIINGNLNLNLSYGNIEAITSFNLNYNSIEELGKKETYKNSSYTPLIIDEAYLRAFIGPVNIEAGFRKLTWGRADSNGPLDVTNPVDFTDLRHITDILERKIARPMLHVTWNANDFSKLEGVFIPNFAPHRFAIDGRWAPSQFTNMPAVAGEGIYARAEEMFAQPIHLLILPGIKNSLMGGAFGFSADFPKTSSLENFQAGLRYTTTIKSADVGAQYYYGNLFRPNFTIDGVDAFLNDLIPGVLGTNPPFSINPNYPPKLYLLSPQLKYTRYHQFGADYAQILYGFNVRAELALNLTEDYNGTDGSLQNPFVAWSLGFDRDIVWGVNLNIQCNETIRLFDSKVGNNPVFDCEAGTNVTNTRLTARLSKKFFRDDLETRATIIWDIENKDCYIIPSIIYLYKDFIFDITTGFFAGDKDGELGQYHGNSFVRLGATYMF